MIDPALLTAFISSKVCHDLVSPVSSVVSAIDLLDEPNDTEMRQQAEELLKKGAEDASIRLQFLRYAFGSIGLSEGAADIHEAKSITEKFASTHKPSVEWDIETGHLSYSHARLMMNVVLMAMDCLPRGGVLNVKIRNEAGGLLIAVTAKGVRAAAKADAVAVISGGTPEDGWTARNIQPLFAKMICESLGGKLALANGGAETVIVKAEGLRAEG